MILNKRLASLDVLRGLAIVLVLFHHSPVTLDQTGAIQPLVKSLIWIGWTGVDLFFVLSGFLIGGLLFNEIKATGGFAVGRFLIRRGFKIWPQYYLYLAATVLFVGPSHGLPVSRNLEIVSAAVVHLQNYSRRWMTHLWSLAVEEHFYLILSLGMLVSVRVFGSAALRRWCGAVLGCVILGVLAFRCVALKAPFVFETHRITTHLRIDSLAAGVLLAWINTNRPAMWQWLAQRRLVLLAVFAVTVLPFMVVPSENLYCFKAGYTALYLGSPLPRSS